MAQRLDFSGTGFALIGAGRMGRRHIHAAAKLGLTLVGVVDHSQAALREVQTEHRLADEMLFSDHAALFAAVVPECLIISTTADSHCALTCAAAKEGVKYILVEKPMAVSLRECDLMLEACSKHGAKMSINHQMRFMEQYSKAKIKLDSDAYGGLKSMTVVAGNFGLAMNGSHYLEAFRYLTEEEPVEVSAWFSPGVVANPRGIQFEDRAGSIRVVTASGKRLYLEIGADQGHGVLVTYAGRNGLIMVNELSGEMISTVREPEYRALPTTRYGMPAESAREVIAAAEVIDSTAQVLRALLTDHNSVTGYHGRMAIEVLAAAYVSAENGGQPIKLDDSSDRSRIFPWA
jgi:predicted dehydrogenase